MTFQESITGTCTKKVHINQEDFRFKYVLLSLETIFLYLAVSGFCGAELLICF